MLEFVSNPEPQLAGGYIFLIIGILFLLSLIFKKSETEPVGEKTVYFCNQCGAESYKWAGKCNACGEWNTLLEEDDNTKRIRLEKAQLEETQKKAAAMRNKYFYKNTATSSIEGPFEKHEIMDMLNKNSINLATLLRKGIENDYFKQIKNYPEFTADLKDFL